MNYKRKTKAHRFRNGQFLYETNWNFKKAFKRDYLDRKDFKKKLVS